jgi:hypothetical protein
VLGHSGTHAINQTLYKHPPYNAAVDFAPVALIAELPIVLIARSTFPADNLREFMIFAKANQAKMQYASPGVGSTVQLACALLNTAIGVGATHIPYRGGGPAMQDLIAGLVDYQCATTAAALPQIESKTVKALAILTRDRSPILPSLASAQEQGVRDFEVVSWNAFFLPKGTPKPIVQRLNNAEIATLDTPLVRGSPRPASYASDVPNRLRPDFSCASLNASLVSIRRTQWGASHRRAKRGGSAQGPPGTEAIWVESCRRWRRARRLKMPLGASAMSGTISTLGRPTPHQLASPFEMPQRELGYGRMTSRHLFLL